MIVYERKFFAQIYFLHRERSVTGFRTQESEFRTQNQKAVAGGSVVSSLELLLLTPEF